MPSSSLILLSITLFAFIGIVQCVNNIYSYDDGNGGEEHCCIARIRENYCLATPITRSLIQVNKQCHQFDGPKHRRRNGKKKNDAYADKIVRRLDVKSSEEIGDKILFELQTPLETNVLQRDLVCLTSKKLQISLDKCHLELADHDDDDDDDDDNDDVDDDHKHKSWRRHKRRRNHRPHRQFNNRKRVHEDSSDEDEEVHETNIEQTEETAGEKEIRRSELHQPVRIREARGLSIIQTYTLNLTRIRDTYGEHDRCLSWYRKQTRKIRHNSSKDAKLCRKLNDHLEGCVQKLAYGDKETNHHSHNTIISLATGSKLYCPDQTNVNKLLGIHLQGVVCLQADYQMTIEQKFSDITGLSDMKKNQDILDFIGNNSKFQMEFGHDCHGTNELVEVHARDEEHRVKTNHHKSKRQ